MGCGASGFGAFGWYDAFTSAELQTQALQVTVNTPRVLQVTHDPTTAAQAPNICARGVAAIQSERGDSDGPNLRRCRRPVGGMDDEREQRRKLPERLPSDTERREGLLSSQGHANTKRDARWGNSSVGEATSQAPTSRESARRALSQGLCVSRRALRWEGEVP